MLHFEQFKAELVMPWHFAPKICFLVNKSFRIIHLILHLLQRKAMLAIQHTHSDISSPFFFARGTELQALLAELLTKGRFGAFVSES